MNLPGRSGVENGMKSVHPSQSQRFPAFDVPLPTFDRGRIYLWKCRQNRRLEVEYVPENKIYKPLPKHFKTQLTSNFEAMKNAVLAIS